MVFFFLRRLRKVILFVQDTFNIVLKILVLEIGYALSLLALIKCVFESLHLVRIVTNRPTRSCRLRVVNLLIWVSVATTLHSLLLIKGT